MREALEPGQADKDAVQRLHAVLSAALKFARAEQRRENNALVFVGLFRLDCTAGCPPVVDLCGVVEALLISDDDDTHRSGHDLLIALANQNNLSHITKYIRTKLSNHEALIVHAYLQRHPEHIEEFVNAIPEEEQLQFYRITAETGAGLLSGAAYKFLDSLGPLPKIVGYAVGYMGGTDSASRVVEVVEDHVVDNSEALQIAHRICDEWLLDYTTFVPRPVEQVVHLLQRLQGRRGEARDEDHDDKDKDTLLDTLRRYMYGRTPLKEALSSSLAAFHEHPLTRERWLQTTTCAPSGF
ncbi:hypothetical protein ACJ41O_008954 [Fusarium nematophilum]